MSFNIRNWFGSDPADTIDDDLRKECEAFLAAIDTDFYITLDKYQSKVDHKLNFNTSTITELIGIAEWQAVSNSGDVSVIKNRISQVSLIHAVLERIDDYGHVCDDVRAVIRDMACYTEYLTASRRSKSAPIKPPPKIK